LLLWEQAPEAAVSISAALRGNAGITIGNVVGSNILNILIILGLCGCGSGSIVMDILFSRKEPESCGGWLAAAWIFGIFYLFIYLL